MFTFTIGSAGGSSGGGSTAAITSGSVRNVAVSDVDQAPILVAATSRLGTSPSVVSATGRGPYLN